MKKILFVCCMVFASMSARAQFTIYQPVEGPRSSYRPSSGYGAPFTIYEPVERGVYGQQAQPRMQQVTMTGYYNDNNGWHSTPIRVGVRGEEIIVLSTKTQHGWANCGSIAGEVGAFDPEEVRDNFNYKAFSPMLGTVYF